MRDQNWFDTCRYSVWEIFDTCLSLYTFKTGGSCCINEIMALYGIKKEIKPGAGGSYL
jgi:hypothetical protein